MNAFFRVSFTIFYLLFSTSVIQVFAGEATFEKPTPLFKQEFDWLKLSSDEWLKGDIISMYDEELEFDSDELDLQTIDWEDVSELRSKGMLSIRMQDGTIADGYLVVKEGKLSLVKSEGTRHFELSNLLSIASSGENEIDLWNAYVNLGANLRRGNTVQFDYTFAAGIQRRSSSSRFKVDYTTNYSKYEDQETEKNIVTANSNRLTSTYDWFFSQKVFLRAVDFESFSDEFINLERRLSFGVGAGYRFINNKQTTWDINVGPSYQATKFIEVSAGDNAQENSAGLLLGTDFTYEVTNDIDYDLSYHVQVVSQEAGEYLHHLQTKIEIELASDLDFEITFYMDRTENPKADAENIQPEKNDYRLVLSLGYDF